MKKQIHSLKAMVWPDQRRREASTLVHRTLITILALHLVGILLGNMLGAVGDADAVSGRSSVWIYVVVPGVVLALVMGLARYGKALGSRALLAIFLVIWLVLVVSSRLNGWTAWPSIAGLALMGFVVLSPQHGLTLALLGPLAALVATTLHIGSFAWEPALPNLRYVWVMALMGWMAMAGARRGLQGQSPAVARGQLDAHIILVASFVWGLAQLVLAAMDALLGSANGFNPESWVAGISLLIAAGLWMGQRAGVHTPVLSPWMRIAACAALILLFILLSQKGLRWTTGWPLVAAYMAYLLPGRWAATLIAMLCAVGWWRIQGNPDADALLVWRGLSGAVVTGMLGALLRHHVYTQLSNNTETDTDTDTDTALIQVRLTQQRLARNWGVGAAVAVALFGAMALASYSHYVEQDRREALANDLTVHSEKFTNDLARLDQASQQMVRMVQLAGGIPANASDFMAAVIRELPPVQVLEIAPKGVIALVEPSKGNDLVRSWNLLEGNEKRDSALQARDTGLPALQGPFVNGQGHLILALHAPVLLGPQKQFWGLAIARGEARAFMDASGLRTLQIEGISYQVWRAAPGGESGGAQQPVVLFSNANAMPGKVPRWNDPTAELTTAIAVPGLPANTWHLSLRYDEGWRPTAMVWLLSQLALLAAFLTGTVAWQLARNASQSAVDKQRELVQAQKAQEELSRLVSERTTDLDATRALLRETLDSQPTQVALVDTKLKVVMCNQAFAIGFGRSVSEMEGNLLERMMKPEIFLEHKAIFDHVLNRNSDIRFVKHPVSGRQMQTMYLPRVESDGKLVGFYIVSTDVNEIFNTRVLLREVLDAQVSAVALFDHEETLTLCNTAYAKNFSFASSDLIVGKNAREFVPAKSHEAFAPVVARALSGHAETLLLPNSITGLTEQVQVVPRRDADGEVIGFLIVATDVTELVQARIESEQAAKIKGQFLANMSHELRTPMNAILGMLNLMQGTELTTLQRDYASKTESAARSLLAIMNDILDFSKVEAGKMALESEPFAIDTLMRDLSAVLAANVGTKNIEVLFDMDPSLPSVVRGDAMRLQQVLTNLGGNAVKFTEQGQVVLSLRTLAQSETSATIEFAVQDTGIGIAPEHQQHIFSGFSQAEGSTTRRFGGTGLGLAISKRFVELMGGDIQITSEQGVGSTFAFVLELPIAVLAHETHPQAQQPPANPPRILVVDDNAIAGELTLRMVRSWGGQAELVRTGQEAIDRVARECVAAAADFPYPVIYMDWKMPDMDGWEATRQIRALAQRHKLPQPSVVMVSAYGREALTQRTEEEQDLINGFLVKPNTAAMLYDALMDARSGKAGIRKLTKGRSSTRQLTGMRILVVEDNLINQHVAEQLLLGQGAIVSLAGNGRLGVEAVAAAAPQFDVVLMDLQMPVLDGYGATRAIREELKLRDLPIIAMTANALASDREACLAADMNEHIGKPFDLAKLVSLLIRETGFQADVAPSDPPNASSPSASASASASVSVSVSVSVSSAPDLPVPEVAGLDIQTALDRMSGMRSLYLRTAKDFVRIMDTAVPELQQCLDAGDKKQAKMRLHTLKGNAGTLGASQLASQAATLEKLCATDEGLQECAAALADFDVLVRTTQDQMRQAIALMDTQPAAAKPQQVTNSTGTGTGTISEAARQALGRIAALAKSSDLDVLQEVAQSRGLLAEFPVESMDVLDEALQSLDLDAASNICDRILLSLNG